MVEEEESWVGQGRRTTWGLLQGRFGRTLAIGGRRENLGAH
jgi:hypothetical protein